MNALTDHRLAVFIDGHPHMFEPDPPVWDDTTAYRHDDCGGADYMLIKVGAYWSWYAVVSPEVTLRIEVTQAATSATEAFESARRAVAEWQALNAW